jgi:hypothetical protein
MGAEPGTPARRVFWAAGNGAPHRNRATAARPSDACPNAQMAHLPLHASRLNQVEACFSVIQRKLLTPGDLEDLDELAGQLLAFEKHHNTATRPSDRRFTRTDLNPLLARIRQHDPHAPHPKAASSRRINGRDH